MTSKPAAPDTEPERHSRKCSICHHPHRDAIEEEFLHWHRVIWIAQQYDVPDHRSIYRHARATGLIKARRENLHSALDNIVEQSDGIHASASDVLRALRAYSCLDAATGRWTELPAPPTSPKQVVLRYEMAPQSFSSRGSRVSAAAEGPAVACDFDERSQRREAATDEAPFATPTSAVGGQMPRQREAAVAEALASGFVGRGFSHDTENGAEDPTTFEAVSASPASAAGGPMPTPTGEQPVSGHRFRDLGVPDASAGNRADNAASFVGQGFRDFSVPNASAGSPDIRAAVEDPSTDSAFFAEPAETDSQVSANAVELRPQRSDDEAESERERSPFLTIQQRDYYDRMAGIDRRPYGRR